MEKKDRPYVVLPYDPKWVEKYEEEKVKISSVFKELALQIEHIGSTSIEGTWAKPQIDILVIVKDLDEIDKLVPQMELEGYIYLGIIKSSFNEYSEKYFVKDKSSGERELSIHVMQEGNPNALSHIYFRDYLRAHPQAREEYSKAKREAHESGADRAEYPKLKKEMLNRILEKAKKWTGK